MCVRLLTASTRIDRGQFKAGVRHAVDLQTRAKNTQRTRRDDGLNSRPKADVRTYAARLTLKQLQWSKVDQSQELPIDAVQHFEQVLASTGDPISAIRAVREGFGLSLPEAKELWLQSTGTSDSLYEHQRRLASQLEEAFPSRNI